MDIPSLHTYGMRVFLQVHWSLTGSNPLTLSVNLFHHHLLKHSVCKPNSGISGRSLPEFFLITLTTFQNSVSSAISTFAKGFAFPLPFASESSNFIFADSQPGSSSILLFSVIACYNNLLFCSLSLTLSLLLTLPMSCWNHLANCKMSAFLTMSANSRCQWHCECRLSH